MDDKFDKTIEKINEICYYVLTVLLFVGIGIGFIASWGLPQQDIPDSYFVSMIFIQAVLWLTHTQHK